MKLFILSTEHEIKSFWGTVGALKIKLKDMNIDYEGVYIKKGKLLVDDNLVEDKDTIYILPTNYQGMATTPIVKEERQQAPNTFQLFLIFGLKLLVVLWILIRDWDVVVIYSLIGMFCYLYYTNNTIIVHNRPRFSNVFFSFLGTLVPGLMEVDPGRILMEMHNAQMREEQAQGVLE